jgi:hypothetical protein
VSLSFDLVMSTVDAGELMMLVDEAPGGVC